MPNPNFDGLYSTNQIWRDLDEDRCLTDDLDAIESDISALNVGKAEANHTHAGYAVLTHTHDAYALTSHEHTGYAGAEHTHDYAAANHTHSDYAASTHEHTGYAAAEHTHDYAAASHQHTEYASAGHTHTEYASNGHDHDLDDVDGLEEALAAKAASSHEHQLSAVVGLLDMLLTDTDGKQKTTITGDVLDSIESLPAGVHTAYSAGGSNATATNAPNTIESWRYLIHKNFAIYGWVLAFGSQGSVFTNYLDGGTWKGWKPIWDNNPAPLWSGASFLRNEQTVTPSKKLSECRSGWILLWSDYDAANGEATNGDVVATYIPKRCYDGNNWSGHSWLQDIPVDIGNAAPYTETRCIKKVYVYDDRITGHAANNASPRNNVVLRAVYEF